MAGRTWTVGTLTYTFPGIVILFAWLIWGDFAWSMRDRSVAPMASWYLNHLGVPNVLFGLLLSSFPSLIAVILCPIISVKSDRHRGKWGRRIPFLLITTPFAALGMIGLGLTPIVTKWLHLFFPREDEKTIALICFVVFWSAFEFATIAGQAVFGALINDVVPTELLGRFYGLFRAISLIDGIIFTNWLLGGVAAHYTLLFLAIGTFYGLAFTAVCLNVKEGKYPPAAPAGKESALTLGFFREVSKYFRECFTHPYYLALFVMMAIAGLSFHPVSVYSIPYALSLGIEMPQYSKAVALVYVISLVLAFPLGWLADRFHPLRMAIASLAGYAMVAAWGALSARSPETFLIAFVLHGVLSGCYYTTAASIWQRLLPQSRFAQFSSAAGLFASFTSMILTPAVGFVIDATDNTYRYTFATSFILSTTALTASIYIYGRFKKYGGPKSYLPPE